MSEEPEEVDDGDDYTLADQVADALSEASDGNLTGFVVVMEWLNPDGSRALSMLKSPSTPPWELQGWLYHILQDPEPFDLQAFLEGTGAFSDDDDDD